MKLTKESVDMIQSACNPVAVARQFAEWTREVASADGLDAARNNPLLLGVLGKLCDMFHMNHDTTRAYAYANTPDGTEAVSVTPVRIVCSNKL